MARALIERLHNGIALTVPAEIVEIGIHLTAKTEIEGEIGKGFPIVFGKHCEMVAVVVGQLERPRGCGTAESDGKKQIIVVDLPVLIAIEVRKILDGLDIALLKDAEVEVG